MKAAVIGGYAVAKANVRTCGRARLEEARFRVFGEKVKKKGAD